MMQSSAATSGSSKKSQKSFLEHVIDFQTKHVFLKVSSEMKGSAVVVKTNPSVITGALSKYWNPSSTSYNDQHVYVPSVRIAGNFEDVRNYIFSQIGNNQEYLAKLMEGTITAGNYNSPAELNFVYPERFDQVQGTWAWGAMQTTYKAFFEKEVGDVRAKNAEKLSKQADTLDAAGVFEQINMYLTAFGRNPISAEKRSTFQVSSSGKLTNLQKAEAASQQKPLNITRYAGTPGSNTGRGTRYTTQGIPKNAYRLSFGASTPLDVTLQNVYFKIKEGESVPQGVLDWLVSVGMSPEQATARVQESVAHYAQQHAPQGLGGVSGFVGLSGMASMTTPRQAFASSPAVGLPMGQPMGMPMPAGLPSALPGTVTTGLPAVGNATLPQPVSMPGSTPVGLPSGLAAGLPSSLPGNAAVTSPVRTPLSPARVPQSPSRVAAAASSPVRSAGGSPGFGLPGQSPQ